MALGARFAKRGLGLFLFGVFATFGIVGHCCVGVSWPTGVLLTVNAMRTVPDAVRDPA